MQTLSRDLQLKKFWGDLCWSVLWAFMDWHVQKNKVQCTGSRSCLMLCNFLNHTNVYGEISGTVTQYGNKNDTRKDLVKVYVCQLRTCKREELLLFAGFWKKDHVIVTLCETHGKTAHFRVPSTAVASKVKYNGIYEKFQQENKKNRL